MSAPYPEVAGSFVATVGGQFQEWTQAHQHGEGYKLGSRKRPPSHR